MNYLPVNVLRNTSGTDCSLNGVTSTDDYFLVVECESGHISEQDIENSDTPVVVLLYGEILGSPHFKPETQGHHHSMMGGNFVYTCDSRFSRKYGNQPIAVHDRFEG